MRNIIIVLFIFFLSGCVSATSPNYYGYKDQVNKFEGSIIIEPSDFISFVKKFKIEMRNNFENKDLGSIEMNENITVKKETDRYVLTSKSDAIDYVCEYSIKDGEILYGNIDRFEEDKFDFSSFADDISSEFGNIEDFMPKDKDSICQSLQNMFRKATYVYGAEVENFSNNLMSNMKFDQLNSLGLGLGNKNFKVKTSTLGIANYNGKNVLVNGAYIGFHMPMNINNQNLDMSFTVKGYSLINVQTGLPKTDQFKMRISLNDTAIMTMSFDTKIENVVLN